MHFVKQLWVLVLLTLLIGLLVHCTHFLQFYVPLLYFWKVYIDDTISGVVSSILYATHCHGVTSLSGELKSILCVLLLAGSMVMAVPFLEATNLVIFWSWIKFIMISGFPFLISSPLLHITSNRAYTNVSVNSVFPSDVKSNISKSHNTWFSDCSCWVAGLPFAVLLVLGF